MAASYDDRKKSYEALDDTQKQKYNDTVNKAGDKYIGNQYLKQRQQEQTNTQQSGTNGQNVTQTPTMQKTENQTYGKTEFDKNEQLDKTMFKEAPGQITVKEGTAAQTGKPDYQLSSEARLNEMKGNLDQYFSTSPRMFSDRETFNKVFEYNSRESEAQRQLLDSYWKRKEDMDRASTYASGESINTGMKNGEITTDQLNLLKEYNPEAYQKWQNLQEDEIKKRIVNDIVPPTIEAISGKINSMIEALGIQAQDALDIEGIYNDTMDRTGAWQTLEDANRTVREIEAITNKKTAIMNRYASSTGGTVSDALAAARMAKAIAPYNEQLQGLQYQYQDYANLYSQKTATATQAANVRAMQAQENQRIWNQKTAALGFATSALSYRTPEENKQLDLQYQQAMNDMNLLQQSRQNDLALYNAYATAKLNNQLQSELTDLSVTDPTQLRANLNNILSGYYGAYGDIIQRPQAKALEDILKYAKDHGISVAQALQENFLAPLQDKQEYKNMVAKNYQALDTGQKWNYTVDEDGNIKINVSGSGNLNLSEVQKELLLQSKQTYSESGMKGAGLRNNNPGNIKDTGFGNVLGTDDRGFAIFATPEDGFDALVAKIQNVQNGGSKTYSPNMTLYDFFAKYAPASDNNNPKAYAESVAKQLGTTASATVSSVDATKLAAAIAKHDSGYDYTTYGKFRTDASYGGIIGGTNTSNTSVDPYSGSIGKTKTGAVINAGGWITSLEKEFGSSQRKSDQEREEMYKAYGIDKKTYDEMEYNYAKYLEREQGAKTLEESIQRAKKLLDWSLENEGKHTGWADIETADQGYYTFRGFKGRTKAAEGKALYDNLKDNETLNKFLDLKKSNASFGQMSEGEWALIGNSTNDLQWDVSSDEAFNNSLRSLIKLYEEQLAVLKPDAYKTEDQIKAEEANKYFTGAVNTGINQNLVPTTNFIINGTK